MNRKITDTLNNTEKCLDKSSDNKCGIKDIPWVEKYRPTSFDNIVLDPYNKIIMSNIINSNSFPNLLLYGPPGTGKTTTIINLIADYQKKKNEYNKELTIHLNASDERGIDIIRNHISQFVNSKTLFNKGTKFIILDEVDSMTKNAQQALKYLLECYNKGVRFCLICNYISRIDESLQNEFLRLRFNQLPEKNIIGFLTNICLKEGLQIPPETIQSIQKLYKSDIRSMINYLQSSKKTDQIVITDTTWNTLFKLITSRATTGKATTGKATTGKVQTSTAEKKENVIYKNINNMINSIEEEYNINIKNIANEFLNYIIRNHKKCVSKDFLNFCESLMHNQEINVQYYQNYFVVQSRRILLDCL